MIRLDYFQETLCVLTLWCLLQHSSHLRRLDFSSLDMGRDSLSRCLESAAAALFYPVVSPHCQPSWLWECNEAPLASSCTSTATISWLLFFLPCCLHFRLQILWQRGNVNTHSWIRWYCDRLSNWVCTMLEKRKNKNQWGIN